MARKQKENENSKVYILEIIKKNIIHKGRSSTLLSKYVLSDYDNEKELLLSILEKHFNKEKCNEIVENFKIRSSENNFKYEFSDVILNLKESNEKKQKSYFYEKVEDPETFEILYENKKEINKGV